MSEDVAGPHTQEGGCGCGNVRYRILGPPMIVHCCHCSWCQRETGSAFVINALIETDQVEVEGDTPEMVDTPSHSGKGQKIARCPHCRVALWSHYAGAGGAISFIRVGTLDHPDRCPPMAHVFTENRQAWVEIPAGSAVFEQFYDHKSQWPEASLERARALPRAER